MILKGTAKLKVCAAVAGSAAVVTLAALGMTLSHSPQMYASGSSGGSVTTSTTPPTVPVITKAEPSITGPAPLYAGQAPNSNPQAAMP